MATFLVLGILGVMLAYGVLPLLNYYVLPSRRHPIEKEKIGEGEQAKETDNVVLSENMMSAFSKIEEKEDKIVLTRAEGVQRVEILVLYKAGIVAIKKRFYLEFADEVIELAKNKKGVLADIIVLVVDYKRKNRSLFSGINKPLFVFTTILQFAVTLAFGISYSIYSDVNKIDFYTYQRIIQTDPTLLSNIYVLPIILAVVVPLISLTAQLVVLNIKGRKEVK